MSKFQIGDFAKSVGAAVSKLDTSEQLQHIDIDLLDQNEGNFYDLSNLEPLADSIAMDGLQQPLVVMPAEKGKVADVGNFWCGQKEIRVLDPNITAFKEKRELFRQYRDTGALLDFTQGLDIRLMDDEDMADLEQMRLKNVHFAWDNPRADLSGKFADYAKVGKKNKHGRFGTVYILTNFNSTMEENLHRIYTVRDLGYDPYVMIYNKPSAPKEIKRLQRWVNNKIIFRSTRKFEEFEG